MLITPYFKRPFIFRSTYLPSSFQLHFLESISAAKTCPSGGVTQTFILKGHKNYNFLLALVPGLAVLRGMLMILEFQKHMPACTLSWQNYTLLGNQDQPSWLAWSPFFLTFSLSDLWS